MTAASRKIKVIIERLAGMCSPPPIRPEQYVIIRKIKKSLYFIFSIFTLFHCFNSFARLFHTYGTGSARRILFRKYGMPGKPGTPNSSVFIYFPYAFGGRKGFRVLFRTMTMSAAWLSSSLMSYALISTPSLMAVSPRQNSSDLPHPVYRRSRCLLLQTCRRRQPP